MQSKLSIPDRLTDFGIQCVCETGNLTANGSGCAKDRTPLELIAGDTPDTSECSDFGFHDFVQCQSNGGLDTPKLGRWLGASHHVGKLMSHWISAQLGILTSVTAVKRVANSEKQTDEMKERMDGFQQSVQSRWEAGTSALKLPPSDQQNVPSPENEDKEFTEEFNRVIKPDNLADSCDKADEFSPDN